ncbi:2OG-Fe(II) oxygenase family protein [Frankia gtarii]|uniref:2OG-Fe(II) oxygenase family protein n=1 Tax=Frankia gtarii TaxID=2950102 RepID=UPI0021BF7358|nr:2OG-Fe(II) oxygenase family protein [Frankia gtarii]
MSGARGTLQDAWATPLLVAHHDDAPDTLTDLRNLVLERQAHDPGLTAGIHRAEKTKADLLRRPEPAIAQLQQWILHAGDALNAHVGSGTRPDGTLLDMVAEAWAVTYQPGGLHHLHAHHDSVWSGVLYVDVDGLDPGTGLVEFLDPRTAAIARHPHRNPMTSITPTPGLLLAFPSWLQHWVTPYTGAGRRISIAFNVGFAG